MKIKINNPSNNGNKIRVERLAYVDVKSYLLPIDRADGKTPLMFLFWSEMLFEENILLIKNSSKVPPEALELLLLA